MPPRARAELLDFFVAVPGLGRRARDASFCELEVPFGTELVHYAVGIASCAVPGRPGRARRTSRGATGGCRGHASLRPRIALAPAACEMPPAHAACLAMLAPVMTMREGARIYSPGGRLLEAGDRLEQPGLAARSEPPGGGGAREHVHGLARRGPARAHGGRAAASSRRATSRPTGPNGSSRSRAPRGLPDRDSGRACPGRRDTRQPAAGAEGCPRRERVSALVAALAESPPDGHTTNLVTVDEHGQRLRLDDKPRPRLGRLPPGLRPPPEQHARRGRPRRRSARARDADGEHDGADTGRRRRRGSSSRSAPPAGRGSGARSFRC